MSVDRRSFVSAFLHNKAIFMCALSMIAFDLFNFPIAQSNGLGTIFNIDNFSEKEGYVIIDQSKKLRVSIKGRIHIININKYVKDINNNHSYNLIIFSTDRDGNSYIIPADQTDKGSKDYFTSSIYETCGGTKLLLKQVDDELDVLEIKPIGNSRKDYTYTISHLVSNDASLAGDADLYFSIVSEGKAQSVCDHN